MLTLEAVSYRYAGARRLALADVSLELRDGEAIGLVGPSEAGKTTLCLVASGLAPRAVGGRMAGRLLVDGEDTADWPLHRLTARVGIAFSNPATQLSGVCATVFEEVAFGPMNLGLPRAEVVERTNRALDALRIGSLSERDPFRLSGGQQQLVAIAGLLAMRPRHLVLDEPTAQLDPAGTALVADALQRLRGEGASVLVAEQKTDVLASVCDRVILVNQGRIAAQGPTAEVLRDQVLPASGVAWPAPVRLRHAAESRGLQAAALARLERGLAG